MSADSQLADALVKAVENSHVATEDDGNTVLESDVLLTAERENGGAGRQRNLEGIIQGVDVAVLQLDVRPRSNRFLIFRRRSETSLGTF
jgi:hypothetical protein